MNRRLAFCIQLLLSALVLTPCGYSEEIVNHFDTAEQVKNGNNKWNVYHKTKAAGDGCAQILRGGVIPFPANATHGVATIWVFDPQYCSAQIDCPPYGIQVNINGTIQDTQGKNKNGRISINGYMEYGCDDLWICGSGIAYDTPGAKKNPAQMRHAGWTRFDFVKPEGAAPVSVYIDGKLFGVSDNPFTTMNRLYINNNWGTAYIYIDEFSFSTDLTTFRPAVVQEITAGDAGGNINLHAGEKLTGTLHIDPAALRTDKTTIELTLQKRNEKTIATVRVPVMKNKLQENGLTFELPTPPFSGQYWLIAKAEGNAEPQALACRKIINVQFHVKNKTTLTRETLPLAGKWDWLRYGEKVNTADWRFKPDSVSAPAAPETVPADWSAAISVQGAWIDIRVYTRELYKNRTLDRDYLGGFYHRKLTTPAEWNGRNIYIDIDEPKTLATVYVDQVKAGEVAWPGGKLELTRQMKPGTEQDLVIFVSANGIPVRGLHGTVNLIAEMKTPVVDYTTIRTYCAPNKHLDLTFDCTGLRTGKQYTVGGTATAAGVTALNIQPVTFTATSANETVKTTVAWKDAILWDIGKPFLYDLNAVITDAEGHAYPAAPTQFGFRELRFDKNIVKMNERPTTLLSYFVRGNNNYGIAAYINDMGYNFLDIEHLQSSAKPGQPMFPIYQRPAFADSAGVATGIVLLDLPTETMLDANDDNDAEEYANERKRMAYYVRKYGNCPSVIFWRGPGAHGLDQGCGYNPLLQDGRWNRTWPDNPVMRHHVAVEKKRQAVIRELDPSRYIIAQQSGSFNDVCHITYYPSFRSQQECIETNSDWIRHGAKPYAITEYAAPILWDWYAAPRWGQHGVGHEFFKEWCALTQGDKAFIRSGIDADLVAQWEEKTKKRIDEICKNDNEAAKKQALEAYPGEGWIWLAQQYDLGDNPRNQVWDQRARQQILNLRADGIGIFRVFGFMYHGAPLRLKDCLRPVTGFVAGPPECRYDQTHIFAPKETLKRGIILLNNSPENAPVQYEWTLTLGGKTVAQKKETVTVAAGQKLHLPITATIPDSGDTTGALTVSLHDLSGGISKMIRTECVDIQILAPRKFDSAKKIALIDPERDSANALHAAGVPFDSVPLDYDLSRYDIVIFGRRAFNYEQENTPEGFDLEALTNAGKKVIILEQDENTLRNRFKFRTEYTSPRNIFAREFGGVLFNGLPDSALAYWRGEATLTAGDEIAREGLSPKKGAMNGGRWSYRWNDGKDHYRPIKWGNRHNLATVMVIKPDTGAFHALADCEFGLNYVAAWQLDAGKGQVVFSQIDVSGRTETGPEVSRYLQNLVTYAASLKPSTQKKTLYMGGARGENLLKSLFIPYQTVTSPENADPVTTVLILGDASSEQLASWKEQLKTFAENGGTIFCLQKTAEQFASGWTPVAVKTEQRSINCTDIVDATDPLLRGLGNSDFFWKGNIAMQALMPIEGAVWQAPTGVLAKAKQGEGTWIFCQMSPETVMQDERYFWLKDSKWNTERLIRTLLLNCGATMNPPRLLKKPYAIEKVIAASVDLSGEWSCAKATAQTAAASPITEMKEWKKLTLPGSFQKQLPELVAAASEPKGLWYKRTFSIPEIPTGDSQIRILVGTISGADQLMINGKTLGQTTVGSNPDDLSSVSREYAIPADLLKAAQNEITIFVDYRDAVTCLCDGSVLGPIVIEFIQTVGDIKIPEPQSLDGWWSGHKVDGMVDIPNADSRDWHRVKVPGDFDSQHAHWANHDGYFWYKRTFTLADKIPAGAKPVIVVNAIDDEDDMFINGVQIGHTGKDTNPNDYWKAERLYPIPSNLLKLGENAITVRVNDIHFSGGIIGSIRLQLEDPREASERKLSESPYLHETGILDDPYQTPVLW